MLIATHDVGFACLVCNRFVVLANGVIEEDCPSSERINRHWHESTGNANA